MRRFCSIAAFILATALTASPFARAQNVPGPPNQQPGDDATAASPIPPTFAPMRQSATPAQGPIRISGGVMAGHNVSKVPPMYPAEARRQHVEGAVVLAVRIGKDGQIEDLQPVSGPGALLQAAGDAVRQWTYQPYLLNGQPVEVNTTVTVNFSLSSSM